MCSGGGGGSSYPPPRPGTGRQSSWGTPAWPPSRRHKFIAVDALTWPFRLVEHDPTCRWRRLAEHLGWSPR